MPGRCSTKKPGCSSQNTTMLDMQNKVDRVIKVRRGQRLERRVYAMTTKISSRLWPKLE
jgi:hypothetical protein